MYLPCQSIRNGQIQCSQKGSRCKRRKSQWNGQGPQETVCRQGPISELWRKSFRYCRGGKEQVFGTIIPVVVVGGGDDRRRNRHSATFHLVCSTTSLFDGRRRREYSLGIIAMRKYGRTCSSLLCAAVTTIVVEGSLHIQNGFHGSSSSSSSRRRGYDEYRVYEMCCP